MRFFIGLLSMLAPVILVDGRPDIISIDCGYSGHPYRNNDTQLLYSADTEYIDSGINTQISLDYPDAENPFSNLRSFPVGVRNCYTINITRGYKYLIRASFLYGDYDNEGRYVTFDLYLGVDLWQTMHIVDAYQLYSTEVITLATSDKFFVCLVRTDHGDPFISALEVRPIDNRVYFDVNQTVSLRLLTRTNMGSDETIRYPNDTYDRIWFGEYNRVVEYYPSAFPAETRYYPSAYPTGTRYFRLTDNPTDTISTTLEVDTSRDPFEVPSALMQRASKAHDNSTLMLDFSKYTNGAVPPIFIYLHFAELENIQESREIQVIIPGSQHIMNNILRPEYLVASNTNIIHQFGLDRSTHYLNLTKAPGSTLPPILNALEAYAYVDVNTSNTTDQGDFDAMMSIRKMYSIFIWQGDPCLPANFHWESITCDYSSTPPRVISLNLSHSGLSNPIPAAIADLMAIQNLDLSNNDFNGPVPPFLANLSSLQILDLSNNKFHDSLPMELCNRQAKGLLELRMEDNPCFSSGSCVCNKQKHVAVVIAVVVVLVVLLILLSVFLFWRRRKRQQHSTPKPKSSHLGISSFHTDNPRFTYQEVRTITNNFERVIGKGGFGTVYYGRLPDGAEVAVKMHRQFLAIGEGTIEDLKADNITFDSHGIKEFQVEVQLLSRVHHRNLVSLIGYCQDGTSLGLVFEYAAQGSLRDHLSEITGSGKIFNWKERLRIAVDAAQGLEYLHKGCKPPIIHRDIKTSNILLSHNFEAKIADFGLSKAFLTDAHTHVSTQAIAGTPGYVDPEYHNTFRLSEKSDVYSFGIVLLELVTGLPAVLKLPETGHILQWVRQGLIEGNFANVVDLRLKRQYDIHSMRKVIDLALQCTSLDGSERPTMSEVVIQLKESLQLEMLRESTSLITYGEPFDGSTSGATEITSLEITELSGPSVR